MKVSLSWLKDYVSIKTDPLDLAEALTMERPDMQVVYMSGYPDNVLNERGALQEDQFFLQKPLSPITLAKKVRQALDEGRSSRSVNPDTEAASDLAHRMRT